MTVAVSLTRPQSLALLIGFGLVSTELERASTKKRHERSYIRAAAYIRLAAVRLGSRSKQKKAKTQSK